MRLPADLRLVAPVLLAHVVVASSARPPSLPAGPTVGSGWGTNIHWTAETRDGEAAMLAKAYRVARMDFKWASIERSKSTYDFAAYDTLLATMEAHGVQPYWILDYGNPLYPPAVDPGAIACRTSKALCKLACGHGFNTCPTDPVVWYCCATKDGDAACNGHYRCGPNLFSCACGNTTTTTQRSAEPNPGPVARPSAVRANAGAGNSGCNTAECIAAFGRFAAAAVAHFKGHNIIFECLNEPNGMGGDNSSTITKLCLAAGAAIRGAGEVFVGPASAGIPWTYLNETMNDGILKAFTALSVHPYRGTAPETVLDDYAELRAMIAAHGGDLPVVSGEWGYTTATAPCPYPNKCDPDTQGAYIARMWLINTLAGIPVSINYDWSDGSGNASTCEAHFGSVSLSPGPNGEPFAPKPKYTAALALQSALGSYTAAGPRVAPSSITPVDRPTRAHAAVHARDVFVLPCHNATGPPAYAVWSNNTAARDTCAGAAVSERADCGHYGISKDQCLSPSNPKGPGCCWEPNETRVGGPQCYAVSQPLPLVVGFAGAPPGQCWRVVDHLGGALAPPDDRVCATAGGVVAVKTRTTSATGGANAPVYLLPSP